ncbi:MAG: GGDEF domain-containing protein [Solirubrobacteraceae bacterium]|nr:GGDEF domain-containing protein [Solirubrobacteraceae bacterium]
MIFQHLIPDLGRVSRRDIALSPAVWIVVWGTFALFGVLCCLIGLLGLGFQSQQIFILGAALLGIAFVMSRMAPPEPDTRTTHALLALTYLGPMCAIIAFGPRGSAVAITAAFAGPLTAVWIVDRHQIAAHMSAATVALFMPSILGVVDTATFLTCACIAPTMWMLAMTVTEVLGAAERQGAELSRLVKRDPLTGAGNRRLLDEELEAELARLPHTHRPFSLLTFDLNGFKALNDTVGHAAGDELLKATADVLIRTARPYDVVVRQGGDEFCMLLPNTTTEDARALAELIRARLQAVRAFGSGISTGIGIATCPHDGHTAASLLEVADARLRIDKSVSAPTAAAWRAEVPEVAPRDEPMPPAPEPSDLAADWTIDGVDRRHLESLPLAWRMASIASAVYALIGIGILLWAPDLAREGLPFAIAAAVAGVALISVTSPPQIGTVRNQAYVAMPYLLPIAFASTTTPGAIGLGLSMFVGPLAAARLVDRRHIVAHLSVATVLFGALLVLHWDEVPTVLSTIIVISNLWVLGFSCVLVLEATETQGKELARLVRRDPLTGLGNRRRMRERLDKDLPQHAELGQPFTVVVLDLEGFKTVNDRIGHAAGDELLRKVGGALKVIAGHPAEAIRQGGDEFAILLPDTTAEEARAAVAAVRRTLGTIEVDGVTVSTGIGIATFPDDGDDVDVLLDRADHRLRTDKYGEREGALDSLEAELRASRFSDPSERPRN